MRSRLVAGPKDLLGAGWALAVWALGLLGVAAGVWRDDLRPVGWTAGFGVAGAMCTANALRSRRLHCVVTGPLLLVGAVLSAIEATTGHGPGWGWIGLGVGVPAAVVIGVELVTGKLTVGGGCC